MFSKRKLFEKSNHNPKSLLNHNIYASKAKPEYLKNDSI